MCLKCGTYYIKNGSHKFCFNDAYRLAMSLFYMAWSIPYIANILNKSENATPELFAIYIKNYANQGNESVS